jgi:hypothetical protein
MVDTTDFGKKKRVHPFLKRENNKTNCWDVESALTNRNLDCGDIIFGDGSLKHRNV